MMKRTSVMLPDEWERRLRYQARRRGIALAEVVREAIGEYLGEPGNGGAPPEPRRELSFIDIEPRGGADTAKPLARLIAEHRLDEHAPR